MTFPNRVTVRQSLPVLFRTTFLHHREGFPSPRRFAVFSSNRVSADLDESWPDTQSALRTACKLWHKPCWKLYFMDIAGQCYKPFTTLMAVYQAMLHLNLHSPDSKRRRWTFVEPENLCGNGRRSFWKEWVNFVKRNSVGESRTVEQQTAIESTLFTMLTGLTFCACFVQKRSYMRKSSIL